MNRQAQPQDPRAGMTLIELTIVIAIITVISAIAIPKFADLVRKTRESTTKGNLSALRSALSIYYGDTEGSYPTDDLTTLTQSGGKYIREIPSCDTDAGFAPSSTVHNLQEGESINAVLYGLTRTLWVPQITNTGNWGYDNNVLDNYFGHVWVDTTLPDTRGNSWLLY